MLVNVTMATITYMHAPCMSNAQLTLFTVVQRRLSFALGRVRQQVLAGSFSGADALARLQRHRNRSYQEILLAMSPDDGVAVSVPIACNCIE